MRPNLAFGPVDSVAQYLLYLSVVVLGIVLPLAMQRWIRAHQDKTLLASTLEAVCDELTANRAQFVASMVSFETLWTKLSDEILQYRVLWEALGKNGHESGALPCPEPTASPVVYAIPLRTAWETANIRGALPLVPIARLAAISRAYQLQNAHDQSYPNYLAASARVNALEAPSDLNVRSDVERRIELLLELQWLVRFHARFSRSTIDACDAAIRGDG